MNSSSKYLRKTFGPLIAMTVLGYFIYHMIEGERGILSWVRLKHKIYELETELEDVQRKKNLLEKRVYLLRPDSLDLDMLEEQARKFLNYRTSEEIVLRNSS